MNQDVRRLPLRVLKLVLTLILFLVLFLAESVFSAPADQELIRRANQVCGPLPLSMPTDENPITPAKVKLGKWLFYESRISVDGTVSCAKCHPLSLYGADGLPKAKGNNCREIPRNSPTILNVAAQIAQHWNGNRTSVEDQAKQSLIGPPSFGMPSYASVEKILKGIKGYAEMFLEAFPTAGEPVTVDNFAQAVGAFERTLVTPAPFDAFLKGNAGALTDRQKRGLKTMLDSGCLACHGSPYLGGQMYQKFGLFAPYQTYTKSSSLDEGRSAVTKNEADKYVFKVPVLRNVAMTRPYFHDGSVGPLEEAVWIMAKVQLGKDLSREQVGDIATFLNALTGRIPADALTLPVLPVPE